MNNSLNNSRTSVKTITLANMGTTKCGKTTSIAVLTNVPQLIIKLASGDDGRTKTTVEYHIVQETEYNGIFIEDVDLFEQNIMSSVDGNLEKYNAQIKKYKVLSDVLKLTTLVEGQNVKEHIKRQIENLKGEPANEKLLKKLMCSETIDTFVRKLILRVPANLALALFLKDQNIDLRIRDTRGLLDIMLNNDLKSQTSKSLSELGLDNLDGIVFFCSDTYPNIVTELYKDVLKSVFESLPVFLVHNRTDFMFEMFSFNGQKPTTDNVKSMMDDIQGEKHQFFKPEAVAAKSKSTFELLTQLNIGKFYEDKSDNKKFEFNDSYFTNERIQFLLPSCTSLSQTANNFLGKSDFEFYTLTVISSFEKMLNMISVLHEGMELIFKANIARNIVITENNTRIQELTDDFSHYDNSYVGYRATSFTKPQLQYLSCSDINNDIANSSLNGSRIGPRGGITTMNNGKLRYATTAVVAVTARRWITYLISRISLKNPLVDSNGKSIFDSTVTTLEIQQNLLRKALLNRLYKNYTDTEATIQYYLLVNRNYAVNAINNTCKQNNSIDDVVTDIVNNFI